MHNLGWLKVDYITVENGTSMRLSVPITLLADCTFKFVFSYKELCPIDTSECFQFERARSVSVETNVVAMTVKNTALTRYLHKSRLNV